MSREERRGESMTPPTPAHICLHCEVINQSINKSINRAWTGRFITCQAPLGCDENTRMNTLFHCWLVNSFKPIVQSVLSVEEELKISGVISLHWACAAVSRDQRGARRLLLQRDRDSKHYISAKPSEHFFMWQLYVFSPSYNVKKGH